MYDIIAKKRDGGELDAAEISYVIKGFVSGEIPDYQMSALLMAIYFRGMSEKETLVMTNEVAESGDMVDLSSIPGIKVDKHSTGGVGDKTTLIVAPIVAACGIKVAKMSGRGLGHTGGTVDKLESIPGYRTNLTREEFFRVVNETGLSVIGQSGNMTPADKKMYALRDVTATVESIPLIAVSIMSKKLAAGSDCILLDVKTGSGAFMKTIEDSIALAQEMVRIGENAGRKTIALITDMDTPLGENIGNSLEVIEAVNTLNGQGPDDITQVCLYLAANMMVLAGMGTQEECLVRAKQAIADKSARNRLIAMVEAQGGDSSVIKDVNRFKKSAFSYEVKSLKSGYITGMDTEKCGIASVLLGAGREKKDSPIDFSAGIIIHKKTGDEVKEGDTLATLYAEREELFPAASEEYLNAITIQQEKKNRNPLIYARVTKEGVEKL